MGQALATGRRIEIIDAFRGFALAGIVLVHMVEQYLAAPPPPELQSGMVQGPVDQVVAGLLEVFVRGKFFALFSFLFGLSFFLQMDRAARRGIDFQGRFIWRLTLLFAIGYLHSMFYRGDILTIYAILGLFLVPFHRVRTPVVLAVAGLLILGVGRLAVFALDGGDTMFPQGDFAPELPHNRVYFDALLSGSLLEVFSLNAWQGHMAKLEFQLNVFGRWYLTFAFFLLGLWAGRVRLFEKLDEWQRAIKKALWASLAACIVFLFATGLLFSGLADGSNQPSFRSWRAMAALTSYDLFNFTLATVILCGFLLVYRRARGQRVLVRLAPYGRTALSNYFMQTLIGTFLLYHWGLGYLGKFSNTAMVGIGVAVIALQVYASMVWLRHFHYGPIEWLWRCGTRLSWQPLLKKGVRFNYSR